MGREQRKGLGLEPCGRVIERKRRKRLATYKVGPF